MGKSTFETGKIIVRVNMLRPERLLNILWSENIKIINAKREDIATIIVSINYRDYDRLKEVVKKLNGKMKVIKSTGILYFISRFKGKLSLLVGFSIFVVMLLYLSTYVWSVEINTKKNVSPYELRQKLYTIGIKPGILKKKIDVKEIEKKLENMNSDILWSRVRIEGSTLKISIEEKINPPEIFKGKEGNLVSKMEGQVSRVYAFSGRSAIHIGDVVKVGDVLIEGINGKEEAPYNVVPDGVVMANTFYEKSMKVKISGTELVRTGERDSDIYIKVFGKKIYLKKAIKGFVEYDKIEESGKIISKINYFNKTQKEVQLTKEEATYNSVKVLEESLYSNLTREAKVVDRIVTIKDDQDGNVQVDVVFVVEQNIVNNNVVDY